MGGRCAVAIGLTLWASAASATPDGGSSEGPTIVMVRGGVLTRARIEAGALVARNAAGATTATRALSELEKARLMAAMQRALADNRPRNGCAGGETFLSVTLAGRTNSSAVCDDTRNLDESEKRWQALLAMLRGLFKAPP